MPTPKPARMPVRMQASLSPELLLRHESSKRVHSLPSGFTNFLRYRLTPLLRANRQRPPPGEPAGLSAAATLHVERRARRRAAAAVVTVAHHQGPGCRGGCRVLGSPAWRAPCHCSCLCPRAPPACSAGCAGRAAPLLLCSASCFNLCWRPPTDWSVRPAFSQPSQSANFGLYYKRCC